MRISQGGYSQESSNQSVAFVLSSQPAATEICCQTATPEVSTTFSSMFRHLCPAQFNQPRPAVQGCCLTKQSLVLHAPFAMLFTDTSSYGFPFFFLLYCSRLPLLPGSSLSNTAAWLPPYATIATILSSRAACESGKIDSSQVFMYN